MKSKNESTGVCEKLFKAVTGSCSHRRSGSGRRPKVTVTVTDSSNLQNADKSGTTHVSVPVKIQSFDHSEKKEAAASVFLDIEGGHEDVVFSSLKEGRVAKVRPSNIIVIEGPDHLPPKKSENHETFTDSSNLQNADKSGTTHVSVPIKIQSFDHSEKKEAAASVFLDIEGGHEDVVFPSLKEGRVAKVRPSNIIVIEDPDHLPPTKSENHETFTEYISRVRDKMRSKSNVGDRGEYAAAARSASRKDSLNDRVANYIHRAGNNIRTPSNVGDT